METLVMIGIVVVCVIGSIMAIVNAIRADPPFTIMEKKKDTKDIVNEDKD
ncbi:MAG: hypothetical protein K2L82_11015 [Lachnospiraceae bacterium]|nr:hypothetical protein [Lachnospiraceae bacterium]